MSYEQGFQDGYDQGFRDGILNSAMAGGHRPTPFTMPRSSYDQPQWDTAPAAPIKPKRKVSAYHKRLGREIKALRKRHMTKAGKWKKGWSQKRMMKQAHKNAKR